jgi:hypothetical protein
VTVLTLLLVLLRRGVHAPLNVKLLALAAAAVVTVALFLRGPSNWSEPPIWGFDILLLALGGSLLVYFVSRNMTAPAESSAPTSAQPAPQAASPSASTSAAQDAPSSTPVAWEEPPTGE